VQEIIAQTELFVQENPYSWLMVVNFVCANRDISNNKYTFATVFWQKDV